jgi:hypothetical protein
MTHTVKNKIANKFRKLVEEMPCPICLGAASSLSAHPTLSKQQFEMSFGEALRCNAGHMTSVMGFNTKEFFIISVMDVNVRPVRKHV